MKEAVANSDFSALSSPFGFHIASMDVEVWKCFQAAIEPSLFTAPEKWW